MVQTYTSYFNYIIKYTSCDDRDKEDVKPFEV